MRIGAPGLGRPPDPGVALPQVSGGGTEGHSAQPAVVLAADELALLGPAQGATAQRMMGLEHGIPQARERNVLLGERDQRFFWAPLNERYSWAAIRYVECNPVRAKIVSRAEKYCWSSAAAHCGLRADPLLGEGADLECVA